MTAGEPAATTPENIKQCCARIYESDVAKLLLGESFHPGGLALTERLGILLGLNPSSEVLDVASGKGISAIYLAERFGCQVVGIDLSEQNVRQAREAAAQRAASRVRFEQADAERLPATDGSFDAVICECAFCTFPDKLSAAREYTRVLRQGGGVGLSDLTRGTDLPKELDGLLAWVACIADAQPLERYAAYLNSAGLCVSQTEAHDQALVEMVNQVRMKLLGVEIMTGLKKIEFPDIDLAAAKAMAHAALEAINQGKLGYAIVCGVKV